MAGTATVERMKCSLVYVTAPDAAVAARLARCVVESRLAACANLLPRIDSIYWWNGVVEQAAETALILKTRTSLVPRLTAELRRLHPYECPCIVALPIEAGHAEFLQWIGAETAPAERVRAAARNTVGKKKRASP